MSNINDKYSQKIENIRKLPDSKLVEKVKNDNCSDSFVEITRRHEKLYFNICSSYSKKVPKLKYDEIIQDSKFVINKAVQTFNPKKETKLSSWIGNYSRYYCLNTIREFTMHANYETVDDITLDLLNNQRNNFHYDNKYKDDANHILHILNSLKDARIVQIFKIRHLSDKETRKWKNISKIMNLSAQRVTTLYKQGVKEVLENINKQ